MTGAGEGFPRAARIRRRGEFLALGRTAERRHTPHFIVLTRQNDGCPRLGVTVSRKVGDAVTRNRVKRRLREVFRRRCRTLASHRDVIVIAKVGAGSVRSPEVAQELTSALAARRRPRA